MPKPDPITLDRLQREARQRGQKICGHCYTPFTPEKPRVRWCQDCRAELKATYDAEREVILAKRRLTRAQQKEKEREEAAAELMAAGLERCPRCKATKDAYDGYRLCESCRAYYRERKAARA